MERTVAWIVVGISTLVAVGLGYRQWKARAWLKQHRATLSPDDVAYHTWSIRRRLLGCFLLLLLAAMLAGIYLFPIASGLDELMALGENAKNTGQKLSAEQRAFLYNAMSYVAGVLLVLMGIFFVAGWDIMAIRRYGIRHRQRIRDDRRAMLERQLPILYAERRAAREREQE
ncbi:MAG TPA: hypothetical protein PKA06_08120 [Gemmatales bacterium]|nr:hypothetical protein [Gemmatales bacterium]